jgi:hypothetical protein
MDRSRMRPQGFTDDGSAAFACCSVGAFHWGEWRSQSEFAEAGEDLDVVVEATFAEFVPGDLVGGVLADQGLSIIWLHGIGSGEAQYSSQAVAVPLAACQAQLRRGLP